jgi:hypothetical protein
MAGDGRYDPLRVHSKRYDHIHPTNDLVNVEWRDKSLTYPIQLVSSSQVDRSLHH